MSKKTNATHELDAYMESMEGVLLESEEELYVVNYYKYDSSYVAPTVIINRERMINMIKHFGLDADYEIKKNSTSVVITEKQYGVDEWKITKIQDSNWLKNKQKERRN